MPGEPAVQQALSPAQLRRIDELCDQFESAFAAGQTPAIEGFLGQVEEAVRPRLLRHLLEMEIRYRREAGRPISPGEAHERLAGLGPWVDAVLQEVGLERVALPLTGPELRPFRLTAGTVFAGRYKMREKLGEGGMGAVWVADQTEPVARRVALKVVRADVSSATLLARFEQERQALALMDHPNIAKVLDAGVADGVPYFVMELIKGVPITKYCDEAKLTPRQRLELFVPVCQAVQHAHQKGVIHRDLKPSNILVGLYNGRPVPKVIDFGVAKVTGPKLSEHSVYTEVGQVVGTLEYMSPEQAELNNLDIDTRADVYALGVVLYELLTGTVPFSRKELKSAGFAEMLRIIKEVEPTKPSTRLSNSGSLPSIAACRQTEPAKLPKLFRGDLDWVVMKALEKDRTRRYETANGLALDIQRYLADEPVLAGPPSAGYQLRKFIKRNRPQVIAAGLVLLALLGGVTGTTWGMLRAEAARKAEAEQREEAKANEQKADEEKRIAQAVRDFLQNKLLSQADTRMQADALLQLGGFTTEANRDVTVRELLNRAAAELTPEKIEENFPKQPLLQAEILRTVGNTYRGVGEPGLAVAFLQRAAALSRQHLPPDHPNTLATLNDLAVAYQAAGRFREAVRLLDQVKEASEKKLGADHPHTLITLNDLAVAYQAAGRFREAVRLLDQVREAQEKKLGADHPHTLTTLHNLAAAYWSGKQLEESIPLFEGVLKRQEVKLGRDHPSTLSTIANLGMNYRDAGRLEEALPLLEEAHRKGKPHASLAWVEEALVAAYVKASKTSEAAPLIRDRLTGARKRLPGDSWQLAGQLAMIGHQFLELKQYAEAEPLLRECLAIREKLLPKKQGQPWRVANVKSLLGGALLGQKKAAEAEPLLLAGYDGLKRDEKAIPPQGKVYLTDALQRLVELYEATGNKDEAAKWRKELEARRKIEDAPTSKK
jgi:serine/threonine protein kinase